MPFKIVRNDITKMNTEAIVNTANDHPTVGTGCDCAVYRAAGYDELLAYRQKEIGFVKEGDAFITPGFHLQAKYIIHTVSPLYRDGMQGEEEKLRSCYRKSLAIAAEHGIKSISFPLISTGGFGYLREEGMRIAADEIHAFLLTHEMVIYLVVFDSGATRLGEHIYPELEEYIDQNYVNQKYGEEYDAGLGEAPEDGSFRGYGDRTAGRRLRRDIFKDAAPKAYMPMPGMAMPQAQSAEPKKKRKLSGFKKKDKYEDALENLEDALTERMKHMSDTFPQYLMYLIELKGMESTEVYKRAIIDRKVFSKIRNNPDYHPKKITALCLCIGARLNLDESRDLLARAGYALSPCDKTDIIFSYFIEHEIYDMIELDIQLEEHGLPCIIT